MNERRAIRAVLVGVLLMTGSAQAAPKRGNARPVVVRPVFHEIASAPSWAGWLLTNGRYVFLPAANAPYTPAGTLIDERTGGRMALPTPCNDGTDPLLSSSMLILSCPLEQSADWPLELYSLSSGQTRTVTLNDGFCGAGGAQCRLGPAGTHWIAISESCYHCQTQVVYRSLVSGAEANMPPTGPTYVRDLDSPSLTRRICAPLRDTARNPLVLDASGSFTVDGGEPLGPFAIAETQRQYLERCDSNLHRRLNAGPITGNRHMLVLESSDGRRLSGFFLPSLRPFVIQLPKSLVTPTDVSPSGGIANAWLTSRTLYIADNQQQLWAASAPTPPATK